MHGRWERQVLAENFRLLETESWRQVGGSLGFSGSLWRGNRARHCCHFSQDLGSCQCPAENRGPHARGFPRPQGPS